MVILKPFRFKVAVHRRITHRESGGRHGERSDARQQGKEKAQTRQEQEEGRRHRSPLAVRRNAQPSQTRDVPVWQKAVKRDPEKPALGLDPGVDTGFPPAQSPTNSLSARSMLRRAKSGRKRS